MILGDDVKKIVSWLCKTLGARPHLLWWSNRWWMNQAWQTLFTTFTVDNGCWHVLKISSTRKKHLLARCCCCNLADSYFWRTVRPILSLPASRLGLSVSFPLRVSRELSSGSHFLRHGREEQMTFKNSHVTEFDIFLAIKGLAVRGQNVQVWIYILLKKIHCWTQSFCASSKLMVCNDA
jgi:hypothetical protein